MQLLAGRYGLGDALGHGGSAVVHHGFDNTLKRSVAIKIFHETATDVLLEARTAAGLSHPNVAQVYDYGEVVDGLNRTPYLVMEFVDGETLADRLAGSGALRWRQAAEICAEVAAALAAAHAQGLVHRDVNPRNIMLTVDGVKVLDFGIAAASGQSSFDTGGGLWGSPSHLAPEQLRGEPTFPAADVYALGLLLFECLTGTRAWPGVSLVDVLATRHGRPAPRLPRIAGLPREVTRLYEACTTEDPDGRPSATTVAEAFRQLTDPQPLTRGGSMARPLARVGGLAWPLSRGSNAARPLTRGSNAAHPLTRVAGATRSTGGTGVGGSLAANVGARSGSGAGSDPEIDTGVGVGSGSGVGSGPGTGVGAGMDADSGSIAGSGSRYGDVTRPLTHDGSAASAAGPLRYGARPANRTADTTAPGASSRRSRRRATVMGSAAVVAAVLSIFGVQLLNGTATPGGKEAEAAVDGGQAATTAPRSGVGGPTPSKAEQIRQVTATRPVTQQTRGGSPGNAPVATPTTRPTTQPPSTPPASPSSPPASSTPTKRPTTTPTPTRTPDKTSPPVEPTDEPTDPETTSPPVQTPEETTPPVTTSPQAEQVDPEVDPLDA